MRLPLFCFAAPLFFAGLLAAQTASPALFPGPTDAKAQQSYAEAEQLERKHLAAFALDGFRKADKEDGHHCAACQDQILGLAVAEHDFKVAEAAATQLLALSTTPAQQSEAHLEHARLWMTEAQTKKKPEMYAEARKEVDAALAVQPNDRKASFLKGMCLAYQCQDGEASAVFKSLSGQLQPNSVDGQRVRRFAERPELVRARMAPPFSVETLNGERLSLDELHGKVVLIDFWATWCGPCREALPHIRKIAAKFAGEPLIVLSISIDTDEAKWRQFVAANDMTWPQAREAGGFPGKLPQLFGVNAIPHTFTIDSDGVLQDEHIGDGEIEGKLKKLVAAAREQAGRAPAVAEVLPSRP